MAPPPSPAILNGSANGNGVHADGGERERKEPEPGSGPGSFEQAVDLNAITHRQLSEDITAYRYDLSFTDDMLKDPNLSLTPQEIRLCQFRMLDLGHQIRHCQHRTEQIDAQIGNVERPSFYFDHAPKRRATGPPNGTPAPAAKRPRASAVGVENGDETLELDLADGTSIQRLGYWMCHLCTANKYLSAGQNRVPSAPCKWPLRDVSKMLTHFLDMHTEHDPEERCQELGNALAANREHHLQ